VRKGVSRASRPEDTLARVALDLSGRTAVITGASRGLGAGLAEAFRARGLRLGLCARSATGLRSAADVVTERLDVRDPGALEAFAAAVEARFGAIDLWVNNAGVLEPIELLRDVPAEAARAHLEVNVLGVLLGTQAFVRHLRRRGGEGVLVNVSSGAAQRPYAGWSVYCASKAAVERMTECVALEEGAHGLRAYAVAPGVVDTDMQALIRATPVARFPEAPRFVERRREGRFNSPRFVAERLLAIAFDPAARPEGVCVRLPDEVT
jgi:NAD(P)-dependent dehydrogenase (short-subunit alcohol dehydrogenase family)